MSEQNEKTVEPYKANWDDAKKSAVKMANGTVFGLCWLSKKTVQGLSATGKAFKENWNKVE